MNTNLDHDSQGMKVQSIQIGLISNPKNTKARLLLLQHAQKNLYVPMENSEWRKPPSLTTCYASLRRLGEFLMRLNLVIPIKISKHGLKELEKHGGRQTKTPPFAKRKKEMICDQLEPFCAEHACSHVCAGSLQRPPTVRRL